jgi:TetR/AcrR family transcriptional regulator
MTIDFDNRKKDFSELPPREKILIATFDTILEDQISGTRLRKIAEKAGIAQGHLHYYFASKDELLHELLDHIIESFAEERQGLLEDTSKGPLEKLKVVLDYKASGIKGRANDLVLFDFWVHSAGNETLRKDFDRFYRPWREIICAIIQQGVESGEFGPQNTDIIPSYIISLMDGAALQYLIDDQAFDLEAYFDKAGEIIADLLKP